MRILVNVVASAKPEICLLITPLGCHSNDHLLTLTRGN